MTNSNSFLQPKRNWTSSQSLRSTPRSDSHCQEPCHHCAKVVVEETRRQRREAVHEGGDGENEGELLVLLAAICRTQRRRFSRSVFVFFLLPDKHAEETELTFDLRAVLPGGVDAQGAEEALHLQDEDERSPPEHHAAEAQALQQARGQSEAVSHPHGDAHSHTQTHKKQTHLKSLSLPAQQPSLRQGKEKLQQFT